jgi:hypothetical protein
MDCQISYALKRTRNHPELYMYTIPSPKWGQAACYRYEAEGSPVTDGNHALCVTDSGIGFQIQSHEEFIPETIFV